MVRRNEIIDRELAQYAADWASDLDDEAGKLSRRMESEQDVEFRLDLVRLIATLREAGALLKGPKGSSVQSDGDAITDDVLRSCARAHAFHLRNAANDAEQLAALLSRAAAILEANAGADDSLKLAEREHRLQPDDEGEKLLPA